jgi:hypothetical protein
LSPYEIVDGKDELRIVKVIFDEFEIISKKLIED